jgi:hypothetical protein
LWCGEWPKGIVRARDGEERNLRPENLILIERGSRPFTSSQVRSASSRHTTPDAGGDLTWAHRFAAIGPPG